MTIPAAVGDLTRTMGALSLHQPVLHAQTQNGTHALGPDVVARIARFLQLPRKIGDVENFTLQRLIFDILGGTGISPCLAGEEIYLILGDAFLLNILKNQPVSDLQRLDLAQRSKRAPEQLTVRFRIASNRKATAQLYHQKCVAAFGHTNVTACRSFDELNFSTFSLTFTTNGSKLRLNIVYTEGLKNEFVATGDAVQIVLPENREPYLVDHDLVYEWAQDTVNKCAKIMRVGGNVSKILFRYLREGYVAGHYELDLFKNEQMQNPSSYSLITFCNQLAPETADQAFTSLLNVAFAVDHLGYKEAKTFLQDGYNDLKARFGQAISAEPFLKESVELVLTDVVSLQALSQLMHLFSLVFGSQKSCHICSPFDLQAAFSVNFEKLAQSGWLRHYLSKIGPVTYVAAPSFQIDVPEENSFMGLMGLFLQKQHEKIIHYFYAVYSRSDSTSQKLLCNALQGTQLLPELQLDSESHWIENLLLSHSDEMRRLGFDQLYRLQGQEELKIKWLVALLKEPSGQALRLILQLQANATVEEMTRWMRGLPQRSYLFCQLIAQNESKWLQLAAQVDPQALFHCRAQNRSKVLQALASFSDPKQLSLAVVDAWADFFEEGGTFASYDRLILCLKHQLPEREMTWPKALERCFSALAPRLPESAFFDNFTFIFHPQALHAAPSSFTKGIQSLISGNLQLSNTQKTHLRVMCKAIVQAALERRNIRLCQRVLDLHLKHAGAIQDEECKTLLLKAYLSLETIPKPDAEWFLANKALFGTKLLPITQLQIVLKLCQKLPALITGDLVEYVNQLQAKASHHEDFAMFVEEVEAVRQEVSLKVSSFHALFPQCSVKKPVPAVTVVKEKKPPSNHVELKQLLKEGKLSECVKKLFDCPPDDLEAQKLVVPVIEAMITRKPIDPQNRIFALLERFGIANFTLWAKIFTSLAANLEYQSLYEGVELLNKWRSPSLTSSEVCLWFAVIRNPHWLVPVRFVELLKDKKFFKEVLKQAKPPDEQNEWLHFFIHRLIEVIIKTHQNSPHRDLFHPVVHLWFEEITSEEMKFELGCELLSFSNPNGSLEAFELDCKLLRQLAPLAQKQLLLRTAVPATEVNKHKKVREALKETTRLFDRFLVPLGGLLRQAKARLAEPSAKSVTFGIIKLLCSLEVAHIDAILLAELPEFPQEAIDLFGATLGRMIFSTTTKCPAISPEGMWGVKMQMLLENILKQGSLWALVDLYSKALCGDGPIVSENSVIELAVHRYQRSKIALSDIIPVGQMFYEKLAKGYMRFLRGCLDSPDPIMVRSSLDIDYCLSYQFANDFQQLIRANSGEYQKLFLGLHVRHIEEFVWSDETIKFMCHILFINIQPEHISSDYNPDGIDPRLVKDESCELVFSLYSHDRYYASVELQPGSEPQIIAYSRPFVLKQVSSYLRTEKKFFELSCRQMNVAFGRLPHLERGSVKKGRLFDFLASTLRVLLELYPQSSLGSYLFRFFNACERDDPFWVAHKKIVFGLLHLAVYKKVLTADAQEVKLWLQTLEKSEKELVVQSQDRLLLVACNLHNMKLVPSLFTESNLFHMQNEILSWCDECLLDNLEPLKKCLTALFGLWADHPHTVQNLLLTSSMDSLLVPNGVFLGLNRGEHGRQFAYEIAKMHLDTLHLIYQKYAEALVHTKTLLLAVLEGIPGTVVVPSLTPCKTALRLFVMTLKRYQRFGLFEGHFDGFVDEVRRIIPLLCSNPKIPEQQLFDLVIPFVHVIAHRTTEDALLRARVELVHEWIVAMTGRTLYIGIYAYKKALIQLIATKFIAEVPLADLDKLLFWLSLIDGFEEDEKQLLQKELLDQLMAVNSRFATNEEKVHFNKCLPKFLQVRT